MAAGFMQFAHRVPFFHPIVRTEQAARPITGRAGWNLSEFVEPSGESLSQSH